jgi:peptidoglycan/LPS O-acetylase OafA/YrhL
MAGEPQTLASVLDAHENSFNVVRLVAASLVIVSHSFALLGGDNLAQPLSWGPFSLGANAVNVFFVLSGIMLSRSFDRKPEWRSFTAARLLRIFPALVVSGVVTAWLIGPFVSGETFVGYFADMHALLYPLVGLFGGHAHVDFTGSPFPGELNSSLWTIKYELLAYLTFGTASALGLLRWRFVAACVTVLLGFALVALQNGPLDDSVTANLVRFGFCFSLGVVLYRFRDSVQIRPLSSLAVLVAVIPLGMTPIGPVAWIGATAYAALSLASVRVPGITRFTNRWDISFGVYLYGWPVQQLLMGAPWVHQSLIAHVVLSISGACLIGWVSFVLVERPAMRRREMLAGVLAMFTGRPLPTTAVTRTDILREPTKGFP